MNLKKNKGFSLVESLVAIGLLAVIVSAGFQFLAFHSREYRRATNNKALLRLSRQLSAMLESPANIVNSLIQVSQNKALSDCALGVGDRCLGSLDPQNPKRFALFRVESGTNTVATQLSSSESATVMFDDQGAPCSGSDCVYEVETFFYGSCQYSEAYCQQNYSNLAVTISPAATKPDYDKLKQCANDYAFNRILGNTPKRSMVGCPDQTLLDPYCARENSGQTASDACPYGATHIHVLGRVSEVDWRSPAASSSSEFSYKSSVRPSKRVIENLRLNRYVTYGASQLFGSRRSSACGLDFENITGESYSDINPKRGLYGSLIGLDATGSPLCQCKFPFKPVLDPADNSRPLYQSSPANPLGPKLPVCELFEERELACPTGEFFESLEFVSEDGRFERIIKCSETAPFTCSKPLSIEDCSANGGIFLQRVLRNECELDCVIHPEWEADDGESAVLNCGGNWNVVKRTIKNYMVFTPFSEDRTSPLTSSVNGLLAKSSAFRCEESSTYCCEREVR